MTWDDYLRIAIALNEHYPEQDPTYIRYTDLHKMICELPGFAGDPMASTESKLEAIQMAWLDEREDS